MVHRVLHAPLGFFLRNPVGEILVAFTKENDIMDEQLIDTMHYLGIYGLIILSTVITVSVTIPMFAVFGGVLIFVTLIMLYFYLPAAAKLKALRIQSAGEQRLQQLKIERLIETGNFDVCDGWMVGLIMK